MSLSLSLTFTLLAKPTRGGPVRTSYVRLVSLHCNCWIGTTQLAMHGHGGNEVMCLHITDLWHAAWKRSLACLRPLVCEPGQPGPQSDRE